MVCVIAAESAAGAIGPWADSGEPASGATSDARPRVSREERVVRRMGTGEGRRKPRGDGERSGRHDLAPAGPAL